MRQYSETDRSSAAASLARSSHRVGGTRSLSSSVFFSAMGQSRCVNEAGASMRLESNFHIVISPQRGAHVLFRYSCRQVLDCPHRHSMARHVSRRESGRIPIGAKRCRRSDRGSLFLDARQYRHGQARNTFRCFGVGTHSRQLKKVVDARCEHVGTILRNTQADDRSVGQIEADAHAAVVLVAGRGIAPFGALVDRRQGAHVRPSLNRKDRPALVRRNGPVGTQGGIALRGRKGVLAQGTGVRKDGLAWPAAATGIRCASGGLLLGGLFRLLHGIGEAGEVVGQRL